MKTYKVIFYDSKWNELFQHEYEAQNKKSLKESVKNWLARGDRWGAKKFKIS